ncbi:hypothetical protein ScPMuIL_008520 [Solemya velum]
MEDDFYYDDLENLDESLLDAYFDGEDIDPELADLLAAYRQRDMQHYDRIAFTDLYQNCMWPTVTQTIESIVPLLFYCFLYRLVCTFRQTDSNEFGVPVWFLHVSSALFGVLALKSFFDMSLLYLLMHCSLSYFVFVVTSWRWRHLCGITISISVVAYLLTCELFLVDKVNWHRIRGAQIILSMKIIGVGFDHSNGNVEKLPDVTQFLGYCLNVGSVIFGPWVSYQDYLQAVKLDYKALDIWWFYKILTTPLLALVCVTVSSCLIPWAVLNDQHKWILAYRDAQSFRFSHYFVSYLSEISATMVGLGASVIEGDVRWDLKVSKPLHVEFPRSLVEVVTNWNIPLHQWLKTYVFRTARPMGTFAAVLFTYIASALLHGLNFQLATVLLSLGFYSYIEFVFREKLSSIFDACIQAKRCKEDCNHHYKQYHPTVFLTNLSFAALAIFHLAYLGLMFDSSAEEEKGYTMQHTLGKWSELNFASHWVAFGTYIFHFLI